MPETFHASINLFWPAQSLWSSSQEKFWSRHTCKGMSAWKATCYKVLWTTPLCLTRVHARDTSRKMMWARNLQFTGRGKEFEVTQWLCYHSVSLFISVAMDSPCVWYTDIYADMRSNNWIHAHVCVHCSSEGDLGSYQSCFCMLVARKEKKLLLVVAVMHDWDSKEGSLVQIPWQCFCRNGRLV